MTRERLFALKASKSDHDRFFDYRYTNSLAHDSFSQQTIAEALMGGTITVVTFQPVTEACSISKAHIAASLISTTPLLIRFIRDKHFDEGLF